MDERSLVGRMGDVPSIAQQLLATYGVTMNLEQLAGVLHRSPVALSAKLRSQTNREPWVLALREAKKRYGRRLLFKTGHVAALLDAGTE